jgi:uncharacterized membrane protein YeiB
MMLPVPSLLHLGLLALPVAKPIPDEQIQNTYVHGSIAQTIALGARQYILKFRRWGLDASWFGLFLIGLWSVRTGAIYRVIMKRRQLLWMLAVGVVGTLIAAVAETHFATWWPGPSWVVELYGAGPRMSVVEAVSSLRGLRFVIGPLPYRLLMYSNALVYFALMALLASLQSWKRLLSPLASVGRMSLTTYLTQSIICVPLFYGFGFGWYGRVGYEGMLLITLIIFSTQMMVSSWWLRHYRFGPAEWFWRSAAYGKPQPMRAAPTPVYAGDTR